MPNSPRPSRRADRAVRALSVGLLLLTLAACGPALPLYMPYEVARTHGFTEATLPDGRMRVTYVAPASHGFDTGPAGRRAQGDERLALAYDFALWRAADLALQRGAGAFAVLDRVNDVSADVRTDYYYDPWPYRSRRSGPFYPYYYPYAYSYDRTATVGGAVTLTVEFRQVPGPGAFDARALIAQMQARYPNAVPPPAGS